MTLEEKYIAGEIGAASFFYLLLARTELEIVKTDLSRATRLRLDAPKNMLPVSREWP